MTKTRSTLLLAAGFIMAVAACEKNAVQVIAEPVTTANANVKFFNFAVGSPNVNFYVSDKKTTAVSSTLCFSLDTLVNPNVPTCTTTGIEPTTGVAYGNPGNGTNAYYSSLPAGSVTIASKIAATTDARLQIASQPATLESGKYYSYYLSGIYDATAKKAESFVVEDVLPAVDFTVAYVRFVNASSTASPMTLFAKNRTTNEEVPVGGVIAYKGAGAFVALPAGSYDLSTRTAGSTANVFTRTAVSFSAGRVYTIGARGNIATASTMALDNTQNR